VELGSQLFQIIRLVPVVFIQPVEVSLLGLHLVAQAHVFHLEVTNSQFSLEQVRSRTGQEGL